MRFYRRVINFGAVTGTRLHFDTLHVRSCFIPCSVSWFGASFSYQVGLLLGWNEALQPRQTFTAKTEHHCVTSSVMHHLISRLKSSHRKAFFLNVVVLLNYGFLWTATMLVYLGVSKYPPPVTLETTLSKSMKVVSLDREGILLSPLSLFSVPLLCSLTLSLSLSFLPPSLPPFVFLTPRIVRLHADNHSPSRFCCCVCLSFRGSALRVQIPWKRWQEHDAFPSLSRWSSCLCSRL